MKTGYYTATKLNKSIISSDSYELFSHKILDHYFLRVKIASSTLLWQLKACYVCIDHVEFKLIHYLCKKICKLLKKINISQNINFHSGLEMGLNILKKLIGGVCETRAKSVWGTMFIQILGFPNFLFLKVPEIKICCFRSSIQSGEVVQLKTFVKKFYPKQDRTHFSFLHCQPRLVMLSNVKAKQC